MIEIILTATGTIISAVSVFSAIYFRRKAIEGERWSTINTRINFMHEQVIEMEQRIQRNGDRIRVVERDTEKLETSVEKKLDLVSEQIEKLQDLIYEIIKNNKPA